MATPTIHGQRVVEDGRRSFWDGYVFGAPVRDMGWFASLLMGFATGMMAFFAATFLGIVTILFWNSANKQHPLDFAWSYSRFGFWIGIVVMVFALAYMGRLWVRRITRKA